MADNLPDADEILLMRTFGPKHAVALIDALADALEESLIWKTIMLGIWEAQPDRHPDAIKNLSGSVEAHRALLARVKGGSDATR